MFNIQKRDSFRIVLARCLRYGVATVKVPVRLALIGGVSFGLAVGIATFAAGSFFTNLIQQARDVYTVYRLTGERDELRESNGRLERQVTALQSEFVRKSEFQRTAREKLDGIERALKAAGALSLFGRSDRAQKKADPKAAAALAKGAPAGGDSKNAKAALASILNSPELSGGSSTTPVARGAKKEDISLSIPASEDDEIIVRTLSAGEVSAEDLEEEAALLEDLSFYLAAVERLPIGSPALGRYSSGFGFRESPFSSRSSFHEGIDVSLPRGSNVVATGAGTVQKVGYHHHYGLTIDIAHTPHIITRYAHLSKASVREGQVVDRGQRIGLSGASGRATGPHVHYEVLFKGRPKNPKPLVVLADAISG